jgi:hypothetical protein
MADKDTDKRPTDEKPRVPNPPTEPLKQDAIGAASPRDPAGNVADSTVTRPTNPGPGAPAAPTGTRPALPAARATPPVFRQQTQPIQPVVPAPSEQVAPGPVGRPDPSRSPEEREATRDAHIEAHAMVNATDPAFAPIAERTVDGEPDESKVPEPMGDAAPAHAGNTPLPPIAGNRPMPVRQV